MMSTTFAGYKPFAGAFAGRDRGNLLSSATGSVTWARVRVRVGPNPNPNPNPRAACLVKYSCTP